MSLVAFNFFQSIPGFLLGDSVEKLALESFNERIDFVVPKNDYRKFGIVFRYKVAAVRLVLIEQLIKRRSILSPGRAVHFHNNADFSVWNAFISETSNSEIKSYSYRDLAISLPFSVVARLLVRILLGQEVRVLKKSGSQNYLNLPHLLYILTKLEFYIKQNNIQEVSMTGIYLPESNLITLFLKRLHCTVSCFVSGTPLKRYLTKIYCDKLYLNNNYQLEEVTNLFHDSIIARNMVVLPPFNVKNLEINSDFSSVTSEGTIGIYTSGIWKRKLGNTYYDSDVEEKELKLFQILDSLAVTSNLKIQFFLHPVEKTTDKDYNTSVQHYSRYFLNQAAISFASREVNTVTAFSLCEFAVVTVSNTLFERLYAGFKTLIIAKQDDWFPGKFSKLKNITFSTTNELTNLLTAFGGQSADKFFSANDLSAFVSNANKHSGK